jgi:hypothetical protein
MKLKIRGMTMSSPPPQTLCLVTSNAKFAGKVPDESVCEAKKVTS